MIKLIIFDLDGCFTDGSLNEHVLNSKDTYSLKKLISLNTPTAIISKTKDIITNKFLTERISYIYTDVVDKTETCNSLLNKLNLKYSEVAYIGDDEPDIELLKKVKISGCPSDAVESVKKVSKFISKNPGGKGAVRDFVDFIIDYNKRISKEIVPVIGIRSGSVRCKNKNTRDFGLEENLLDKKLRILSSIDSINKIIVSSDSDDYLKIASRYSKVVLDKRDFYYASSKISGKELFNYLGNLINEDEVFMYSPVVSPFLNKEDYLNIINKWCDNLYHDSVCSFHEFKEFLWGDKSPINYKLENAPSSQDLPEYYIPTLGCCIIEKEILLQNSNVIGKNPLFVKLDKIKSIDIDDNYDFAVAKLLNENNINDMFSLEKYLDKDSINILDCTVRDGGYRNNWEFADKEVFDLYKSISDSGIEYFEIGFRSNKVSGGGKWFYSNDGDINYIKKLYKGDTPSKIAVMFKYGEYGLNDIKEDSSIDLYRILIKSEDYTNEHNNFIIETIRKINSFGKEVGLNIPCGHKINKEISNLIKSIYDNNLKVDVFYLADTFGSMDEITIVKSFNYLYELIKGYDKDVVFGFHSHDNNSDALLKTLYAIDKIHNLKFVDSCILGMGRGIGNLKTEDVLLKLNNKFNHKYDKNPIYELIHDKYDKESILYKLSADYKVHPNYVNDILDKKLNFKESLKLIKELSDKESNKYKKL